MATTVNQKNTPPTVQEFLPNLSKQSQLYQSQFTVTWLHEFDGEKAVKNFQRQFDFNKVDFNNRVSNQVSVTSRPRDHKIADFALFSSTKEGINQLHEQVKQAISTCFKVAFKVQGR